MKSGLTALSNQVVPGKASLLREINTIYQYHQRSTREFAIHDYTNVYKKTLKELRGFGLESIEGKEILDLGCGARFPFSLLAASDGASVTALDISYVKPHALPVFFLKILMANGLKRAAKSSIRKLLFDKLYLKQLEASAGKLLSPFIPKINFVLADPTAGYYQLPSGKYDVITSNAVLEHVGDLKKYFLEVYRLLKKGGLAYGFIHNYYSISGGHNLANAFPDTNPSPTIQPWDHLRRNQFPTHIYLNKLKPSDYKAAVPANLEILLFEGRDINHDKGGLEGERYLTPEVQAELSQYPAEILLTRSYCIICRKL
ncbi:MAG: class I SAM-dependent methyltransferase [Ferruginibacter sp.]